MADFLWFFAVAIGPAILAIAFIWAILRRRRLTTREQIESDRATEKLYREKG